MRIGINARTFSVDEPGGAVQSAMRTTTELINNTAHQVVLFGSSSLSGEFDARVQSSGYYSNQMWGVMWERTILPWLSAKANVDVLYCPNGNAPLHKLNIPVVMCIHDVNAQKGWSASFHSVYRKLAVPRAARVSDAIVTVSEFSKQEIVNHNNINEEAVEVIYNGVDGLYFSDETGDSLDLPQKYVLFVGSMNPRKNLERVVEAFTLMKDETDLNHSLIIVGPDNKTIFEKIEIDDHDDVMTLGFISENHLKYAYDNADLFVFPSLYEGFGLPPLEAMACGTPVLASETTVFPETLGDAAKLVNPYDIQAIALGMETILTDPSTTEQLTKRGRERVKQFQWTRTRKQVCDVLQGVVNESKSAKLRGSKRRNSNHRGPEP